MNFVTINNENDNFTKKSNYAGAGKETDISHPSVT